MKIILLLLLLIIILNYLYVREYLTFIDNPDSKITLDRDDEQQVDLAEWFERATELKLLIFD